MIIPIFGASIINSDGRRVDVKDLCERDHILPDYQNRFIPTLSDFVRAIDVDDMRPWQARLDRLHGQYRDDRALSELLLSPLAQTGLLSSLLLTHNSWFLLDIAPKVLGTTPALQPVDIAPAEFFEAMRFELWMDNGADVAPSARKLKDLRLA